MNQLAESDLSLASDSARRPRGRHTHPGAVAAYVQEGVLTLDEEGKPTTTLKAGDSFFIKAGNIHEGSHHGTSPVKAIATFAVEKGKPLTTLVQYEQSDTLLPPLARRRVQDIPNGFRRVDDLLDRQVAARRARQFVCADREPPFEQMSSGPTPMTRSEKDLIVPTAGWCFSATA